MRENQKLLDKYLTRDEQDYIIDFETKPPSCGFSLADGEDVFVPYQEEDGDE